MIQRAKTEVFKQFLDFGLLDRLDIPNSSTTKSITTFCNITRSRKMIQKSRKSSFEWSKVPKKGFSAHYLGFNLLDRLDIAYIIEVTSGLTSCDIFARFITFGGGFFHLLEMLT